MFSVGLLYSVRDFLKLIPLTGLTPEEFKRHFEKFKYSTSDKILEVCFKCGWSKLTQSGKIESSSRGREIASLDYRNGLLFQLEDLISNFSPTWACVLPKGRTEARNFLPADAFQCFKECGMFDKLNEDIIKFWDKLALAYRSYNQNRMTEIGRSGERLSFEYEFLRTGIEPIWQAVESNIAGYDILSIMNANDTAKLQIEVKASTASLSHATIHISRNEWETASTSLNYSFHLWLLGRTENKLFKVSTIEMKMHIPGDNGDGKWESVSIPFKFFEKNLVSETFESKIQAYPYGSTS